MQKIEKFTRDSVQGTWDELTARLASEPGVVWELRQGEDFTAHANTAVGYFYNWARKHGMKARCSIPELGVVQVRFTKVDGDA